MFTLSKLLKEKKALLLGIFFAVFSYSLHAQVTFRNTAAINMRDGEVTPILSNPYPSPIEVSGLSGIVTSVSVTLFEFSHTFPDAVDILLVAPDGKNTIILSDVGG